MTYHKFETAVIAAAQDSSELSRYFDDKIKSVSEEICEI